MDTSGQYKQSWMALVWPLGILVTALLLLMIVQKLHEVKQSYQPTKPENTISISAEGKVTVVPDTAVISAGVIVQGRDIAAVQDDAAKKINAITAYVKSLGVAKEDITTTQSDATPQYDYSNGKSTISSYQSNQTITIKVRGVNKDSSLVGKLKSGVIEKGANQVYGTNFIVDDPDNFRQEARKQAIEKAKQKAEELAEAAGLKLGRVVSLSESGATNPYYPPIAYDSMASRGSAEKSIEAPNTEVGSQEISQTMTVIFEIK